MTTLTNDAPKSVIEPSEERDASLGRMMRKECAIAADIIRRLEDAETKKKAASDYHKAVQSELEAHYRQFAQNALPLFDAEDLEAKPSSWDAAMALLRDDDAFVADLIASASPLFDGKSNYDLRDALYFAMDRWAECNDGERDPAAIWKCMNDAGGYDEIFGGDDDVETWRGVTVDEFRVLWAVLARIRPAEDPEAWKSVDVSEVFGHQIGSALKNKNNITTMGELQSRMSGEDFTGFQCLDGIGEAKAEQMD
ncbi:MAG: hypothetical protein KDA21_15530, partial [Phycisphaerales bacterium]|nr:hypothetical protein [Phycisphaerales bacterium]